MTRPVTADVVGTLAKALEANGVPPDEVAILVAPVLLVFDRIDRITVALEKIAGTYRAMHVVEQRDREAVQYD